jgi:endonuclease-8
MFGQYRLNEERQGKTPTAELLFEGKELLRLYAVSLRLVEGLPDLALYPPGADVLNKDWDGDHAIQAFKALLHDTMICDALMDQTLMAGVGNAIKNEALWACRVHPATPVGALSGKALKALIQETVDQSYLFLEERRIAGEGRYPWTQVFRRKQCPRCGSTLMKESTGVLERVSFWCPVCQVR